MIVIIALLVLTFVFGFALGNRNPRTGSGRLALLSVGPALLLLAFGLLMVFALGQRGIASFTMLRSLQWALSFASICVAGVVGVLAGQTSRRGSDGQL